MITKKFIEEVRGYFDLLGIEAYQGIDWSSFEEISKKKFNRSQDLNDARDIAKAIDFCSKNWSKIEKMFLRNLDSWQYWKFNEKNEAISLPDE